MGFLSDGGVDFVKSADCASAVVELVPTMYLRIDPRVLGLGGVDTGSGTSNESDLSGGMHWIGGVHSMA